MRKGFGLFLNLFPKNKVTVTTLLNDLNAIGGIEMSSNDIKARELLDKIASKMGVSIASWKDVDEAIEKDISFAIIVNPCKYMDESDMERIAVRGMVVVDRE